MNGERVLADQTVVVEGERIKDMGDSGTVHVAPGALEVDGRGKYLVPGLIDLHVHLFSPDDFVSYIAHGVTTVADMSGSPLQLEWRRKVRDRALLGPNIYTAGTTIDGLPPLNEQFATAETPEQARALVRAQHASGYDYVKVYGTLRPDVFREILKTAGELKMPVVGHINRQVGALEVLNSSQVLAAHLEDLMFARFDQPPGHAELVQYADAIAKSKITVTPNVTVGPSTIAQISELNAVLNSPEARSQSPAAYSQWMKTNNRNPKEDDYQAHIQMINDVQKSLYTLVNLLRERNVPLVLGTDAVPYGFAGSSAHDEVRELVKAGFSPYDALRTGTVNAGKFIFDKIDKSRKCGLIERGAQADLLLLSANPLVDVENLEKIEGVLVHGKWHTAAELSRLRAEQAERFSRERHDLDKFDSALEVGDLRSANSIAKKLAEYPSPWISEWVLMKKARSLQAKNLSAALETAKLATRLFPSSFACWNLLADLHFQQRDLAAVQTAAEKSQALMPNATATNLLEKVSIARRPPTLVPGEFELACSNYRTREVQHLRMRVSKEPDGYKAEFKEGDNPYSPARELTVGGDQVWAIRDANYGSYEYRMHATRTEIMGYWAGPFGQNGKLTGWRIE